MKKKCTTFMVFTSLLFVFLWFSCEPVKSSGDQKEKGKAWALISFTAGNVQIETAAGIKQAEPGQLLGTSDRIRTGENGLCEIQIASQALVRLEASSTLSLHSLTSDSGSINSAIELIQGSILVKVRKLLKTEDFIVLTDTGTAGVRGTVFKVTSSQNTVFELAEGSLAILPLVSQLSKLTLTEDAKDISAVFEESAYLLKDSGVVTVTTDEVSKSSQDLKPFLEKMDDLTEAENVSLKELMAQKKEEWTSLESKPLDTKTSQELSTFAQNAIVTNLDKLDGTEQTLVADFSFKRIAITTEPVDAWLSINSTVISNVNPKILVQTGALVSISVGREGFETYSSSIKIDSSTPENLVVSLKAAEKVMTTTDWANVITQEVYHWFSAVAAGDMSKLRLLWPSMTSQNETGLSQMISDRVQLSLLSNPVKVTNAQKDRLTIQLRYRMKRPEEASGVDFAEEWVYIRDPFSGSWIIESQRTLL